jgi:hypothetical protein
MEKKEILILCIIIGFGFFSIFQKDQTIDFMNSIFGKLIIILLIVIFMKINMLYGVFFLIIIIIIFKLYDIHNIYYIKNIDSYRDYNDYLDNVDIIYWINLDRSTDRKKHMNQLLKDSVFDNIPNHRITAYDGKQNMQEIWKNLAIITKKLLILNMPYYYLI